MVPDPDLPDKEHLTPVMRQYREIKARHPDTILFFHIGDFYETFENDAETISRELDIVLTSRSKSGENRVPLAGVPWHAADGYIAKLVGKGYRVAVCDQVEDAKSAKGIVKRDVVRVITPGTVIDSAMVPSSDATYLMAVCPPHSVGPSGIALLDISTGEFFASEISPDPSFQNLLSEIARYRPAECIVPSSVPETVRDLIRQKNTIVTVFRDDAFDQERASVALMDQFGVVSLAGYGCDSSEAVVGAAGAALVYALETQNTPLAHISGLTMRASSESMVLDAITLRNLEVTENIRGGSKGSTLYSCLNLTKTPMGSRLLHRRLTRPLLSVSAINGRLDAVEFLAKRTPERLALRSLLAKCSDIERIAARIAYGNAGPRDLVALADSLEVLPEIKARTIETESPLSADISDAVSKLCDLSSTIALIRSAITDDPPVIARNGGVIRPGYSQELDETAGILSSGKGWIAELQQKERERTGIKSLKIGYNRIFGYYIDITKPNLHLVPESYERKQTTATGERFTIPELREKESLITNADERVLALERELYTKLLDELKKTVPHLQEISLGISVLDVTAALAEVAQTRNYVRPTLNNGSAIVIRDGRHPVVEQGMCSAFVPNDIEIASDATQIMIITGANMAGKSTFMRAVALICIMAQAGSYVPALSASVGVIDRVFTRVGAFDDLASGQSTFFVEMLELANILNNVTERSLVILDEIGRGTSTADGCSIARSVLEYLHGKSQAGPKTLFATHFHELIDAENEFKRVKNYHFAVKETKNEIVFLRKLIPGATDKSYGIHVAQLAGIPRKVTSRAEEILKGSRDRPGTRRYTQLLLVDAPQPAELSKVLEELDHIDPHSMTPLDALLRIAELKKLADTERNRS